MGTILVKSALNALKIEVLRKNFFSLKKFNLVAHVLLLTFFDAFKALFTKVVPIFVS